MEQQTTEKIGRMEYEADKRRIEDEEKRQNHRLDILEAEQDTQRKLITTVEKIALTLEATVKKVDTIDSKVSDIEKAPAAKWEKLCWVVTTAFVTAIITSGVAIAIRVAGL